MTGRDSLHLPRCGAPVRGSDQTCARAQGHKHQHRTREAMDHQMRMACGHLPRQEPVA